jgi:hypothetical protein
MNRHHGFMNWHDLEITNGKFSYEEIERAFGIGIQEGGINYISNEDVEASRIDIREDNDNYGMVI